MEETRKRFYLFILDQAISGFASTFGTFALSWGAYTLTGSKVAMGSLWMITLIAQMMVRFFIGPYIDQWSRVLLMKLSEMMRLLSYLYLLIVMGTGHLTISAIYIVAFLTSIIFYDTATSALLPSIISKDQLVKSNAKISAMNQLVRLLSLPASGLLIGALKLNGSFVLIVVLFFISFILLKGIKEPERTKAQAKKWRIQIRQGAAIYKRYKILLMMSLFIAITSFGVSSTQAMYLPYVTEVLKGTSFVYGLFIASFPLGYIIGSYIVGKWHEPKKYLYLVMVGALFFGGLTYIGLGLTKTVWIAIVMEVIGGMVMPFWNIHSTSLYQRVVPDALLGQVFSMRFLLTKAINPFGILYGTFMATHFNLSILFVTVGSIICFVSGMGMILMNTRTVKQESEMKEINL